MDATTSGVSANASTIKDLILHYALQKTKWRGFYYASKVATIVLAAAIPVMTTADSWPWTIAIVGSLIVAIEGIAELWHFHDRYVAARMLQKALDRERRLYEVEAGEYEKLGGNEKEKHLAVRISILLDRYEAEIVTVLKEVAPKAATQ